MREYFGEVFDSSFNISGSGCNISVFRSAGPNIPKQLPAKL